MRQTKPLAGFGPSKAPGGRKLPKLPSMLDKNGGCHSLVLRHTLLHAQDDEGIYDCSRFRKAKPILLAMKRP